MRPFFFALVAASCLLHTIHAISVDIQPHSEECFFEDMDIGDKLTVSYQVSEKCMTRNANVLSMVFFLF